MDSEFTIYCFPISGGGFISQLGLLCEIYDANKLNSYTKYSPDLILASSGGNIVSYIGLAADWAPNSIKRIVSDLKSEMFIKSWLPNELSFIPTWIIGSFKGSIYKKGYGCYELFNYLFTEDTISRTEIWTGTYDITNNKAQFFCNLSKDSSFIKSINESLFNSMPLKYCDSDIKYIADTCIASASIPMFVENKNIKNISYCDGGMMYASPLNSMSSEICKIVSNKKLRLIYFSSYDIETYTSKLKTYEDDFENFKKTLRQIIHTSCILDRNSAIDILYKICNSSKITYLHKINLNTRTLADTLQYLNTFLHYVIVLYPKTSQIIPIVNFTNEELLEKLNLSRQDYGAHIWYFNSDFS